MKEIKRFWKYADIGERMFLIGMLIFASAMHIFVLGFIITFWSSSFVVNIFGIALIGGLLLALDGIALNGLKNSNDHEEWRIKNGLR